MNPIFVGAAITIAGVFLIRFGFRKMISGPVDFHHKEVGTIFYVLKVSEDKEVVEMFDHHLFPATKGREYLVPQNSPDLEPGKTYELESLPMGGFALRQVAILMTA